MSGTNRPFKYGPKDRREFIVMDSEVALQAQNDSDGNPVFVGRAKIGTATSEDKWQISFITYDANQGVVSVEWPENSDGNPSGDYGFVWDNRAALTYN